MNFRKGLFLSATLLAACTHTEVKVHDPVVASWTEINSDSVLEARAVVDTFDCPRIQIDQTLTVMKPRSPQTNAFPILVCTAIIPQAATSAQIGHHALALLKVNPQRIMVVGDTGCRLKAGKDGEKVIQACNDPKLWPFAKLAEVAAKWKPDLVIHVGDYHYRETECPPGDTRCQPSSAGDKYASWKEDLLNPVQPLFAAAPWVFVRGNHENCMRGGIGWGVLIDPRPFAPCVEQTQPFQVQIGDHTLAVVDASDDANVQKSIDLVKPTPGHFQWLALHRPLLTPGVDDEASHAVKFPKALLKKNQRLGLVLVGHVHILSINRFKDNRPPEVISGNSGTSLATGSESFEKAVGIVSSCYKDFGFFTMERKGAHDWLAVAHDRDGKAVIECKYSEFIDQKSQMDCHPADQSAVQSANDQSDHQSVGM